MTNIRVPLFSNPRIPPVGQSYTYDSPLILSITQPASALRNYDFPNPIGSYWDKTYINYLPPYVLSIFPFNNYSWPNPQTVYWNLSPSNLNLTVNLPLQTQLVSEYNWRNPEPKSWFEDWNLNLIPILVLPPTMPFNQYNWPNPQRGSIPIDQYLGYNQILSMLKQPASFFQNYDWPNPKSNPRLDAFYSQSTVSFIRQQPASFFNNYDQPLPKTAYWYREWTQNLLENTLVPPIVKPFKQTDYPNPRTYTPIDQFYEYNQIQFILSQPASFFNNYDFPNPRGNPRPDVNWLNPLSLLYLIIPFAEYDWPNPKTYTPIDQFWVNSLNLLPAVNASLPFNQHDWPNSKDYQRIDEFFWQDIVNTEPPPPPVVRPISSGRQIQPWEVRASQGFIDRVREYASKGGQARSQSLTSNQKSAAAAHAAAARWKK